MRQPMTLVLVLLLAAPQLALAADPLPGGTSRPVAATIVPSDREAPLAAAAAREVARLAAFAARSGPLEQAATASRSRGWIARHPALFGALVGAGAGAVASVTMENELFCSGGDEDCFFHGGSRSAVGAGIGAGVGALVGLIAGLGSK